MPAKRKVAALLWDSFGHESSQKLNLSTLLLKTDFAAPFFIVHHKFIVASFSKHSKMSSDSFDFVKLGSVLVNFGSIKNKQHKLENLHPKNQSLKYRLDDKCHSLKEKEAKKQELHEMDIGKIWKT